MRLADSEQSKLPSALTGAPRATVRLSDSDFDVLFSQSWLSMVRTAAFLLGDRAAAQDIVQDAYSALYQRWPTMRDLPGATVYLRICVVNGSRSALRRRRIARAAGPRLHEPPGAPTDLALLAAEEHREVLRAVSRLPRRQREVIVLRYWAELSEAEIAVCLGISRGSVKSAASRGLASLEQQMRQS